VSLVVLNSISAGAAWRRAGRAALAAALLAGLAGGGCAARAAADKPAAQDAYAHAGRLVRLPDGRRINLRCSGRGSPTVLLESGFGGNSSGWARVQPRIAAATRVCAYDRAGYGFSDPGPLPRDGAAAARDLDRALKAGGVRGPYVVVGHSAGGLYARLFAGRRTGEVVGLVFVDSSVEYQDRRMAKIFGPGAGSIEGIHRRVARCLDATSARRVASVIDDFGACVPKTGGLHARMIALRPSTWRGQLSEIDTLFTDTSEEVSRMGLLLQDVPAIVLTASPTGLAAGSEDPGAAVWQAMHRDLAHSFRQGEQRIVRSSHLMMNERPDVVAGAVLQLVEAARPHTAQATPAPAPQN
jgi:pimeloyl-ACP methyl ester carboxylesterase